MEKVLLKCHLNMWEQEARMDPEERRQKEMNA